MGTHTAAAAAAIYTRISNDPEGTRMGVARQEEDCRALAARHGLQVAAVYTDNDISASTRSRKRRPGYEQLLADAKAGRVGVVLAYSNSRLTRRLSDLEALIGLAEQHGTRFLTVVSGEDNLATADGRMVARIKASVDAAEAERTSERVRRAHLGAARLGKPVGGTRPFGWQDDKRTLRQAEAELVRQAAADVVAGVGTAAIAKAWNAAGVRTSRGGTWTAGTVLRLLRSPRLAGWRVHRPGGVGNEAGRTPWAAVPPVAVDASGQPVRGQWEPILDEATYRAVLAKLTGKTDARARVPRRNARHYLLTGLLRCAVCNGPMYANRAGGRHYYRCDAGHRPGNTASGTGADQAVARVLVEYSALVEEQRLQGGSADAERISVLNQQIDDHTELIDDVMSAFRARTLQASTAFKTAADLEASREALVQQRDAALAAHLASTGEAVTADTWATLDTDRQRALLEARLQAVYVRPATAGATNTFDASRLDYVWR